jgi:hypothetical protein
VEFRRFPADFGHDGGLPSFCRGNMDPVCSESILVVDRPVLVRSRVAIEDAPIAQIEFRSLEDLEQRIMSFVAYFSRTMAKPFKWMFQGFESKSAKN